MVVETLVPVDEHNFDGLAYMLANPDLQLAGVDPIDHYMKHGKSESRLQINPVLLGGDYRKKRFDSFKNCLNIPVNSKDDEFPLFFGSSHYNLGEYQAESANDDVGEFVSEIVGNPDKRYMDLGCGLRKRVFDNCLYVEVYPSICADIIVEPSCVYPVRDESFDGIGCFAVLEHTRQPWIVVREMHRMLKPGGKVWIDWPFLQPIHGFPSHFFNATREGLVSVFEDNGFRIDRAETGAHQGLDHTITWILGHLREHLPLSKRAEFERMTVAQLISEVPQSDFWRSVIGAVDDSVRSKFACGNFLVATKR